ncbi:hypothetical protein Droror1_Dr00010384 [Drosera rotundifolia]
MANSPMHLSIFFLVSLLIFFGTVSARDSHFFSKITRENTNANDDANIKEIKGGVKVQEVQVPAKEETTLNKAQVHLQVQEQEPSFIPQTNENGGYGLYGHESGLLPPSAATTTTNMATVASNLPFIPRYERPLSNYNTERFYSIDREAEKKQEERVAEDDQDAYLYTNAVYYNPEHEGLSGKEFMNNARLGNGEAYNYNLKQERKKGMSDTRFLDNGKYYYDAYSEKNVPKLGYSNYKNVDNVDDSYPGNNRKIDAYFKKNVRTLGYPNYDNEKVNNVIDNGYFGDNEKANAYRYNNGMQGYKNKEEQEITAFGP